MNLDDPVQLRQIAIIDLEASGLGSTSFPTEIGWATIHDDGSIASASCLIRPAAKWLTYQNAWSAAAERLTGISMQMLLDRDGLAPREALARFLEAIGDRDVYSDNPDFDAHWLGMLADAAGVSLDAVKINNATKLIEQMEVTAAFTGPPRHRAEADARRLALVIDESGSSAAITVTTNERRDERVGARV